MIENVPNPGTDGKGKSRLSVVFHYRTVGDLFLTVLSLGVGWWNVNILELDQWTNKSDRRRVKGMFTPINIIIDKVDQTSVWFEGVWLEEGNVFCGTRKNGENMFNNMFNKEYVQ